MAPQPVSLSAFVRSWNGVVRIMPVALSLAARRAATIPLLDACAISSYAAAEPTPARPRREAIVDRRPRRRASQGPGVDDGPRCGRRDGHVVGPHPPLLRVDGRGPGRGLRAGREARTWRLGAAMAEAGLAGRRAADLLPDLHPGRQGLGVPALARCLGRGGPTAGGPGDLAAAQPGLAGAAGADDPSGVAEGAFSCPDPRAPRGGSCRCSTGWRSRSSPTARRSARRRRGLGDGAAERELGLAGPRAGPPGGPRPGA